MNPIPADGDHFGWAVAPFGADVLVGAPLHDETGAINTGVVYLMSGATGTVLRTFRNPTPASGDEFGRAVAAVGSRILVGAPRDNIAGPGAGAAYLFDGTTGALLRTFLNPAPGTNDHFGWAVAKVGSNVLIGAPLDDTGVGGGGAAYVFQSDTGSLLQVFLNPQPAAGDEFGSALAALGTGVIVGAPHAHLPATPAVTDTGAAYLFDIGTGAVVRTFLGPAPTNGDLFGSSLAAVGPDILIGAPLAEVGGVNAGMAYLFNAAGTLLKAFQKPIPKLNDQFGLAVAAVGSSKVLIAAPGDDAGAPDSGAAYLFHAATGVPLQVIQKSAPASGDDFGSAVASVSTKLLVGAPLDDALGTDAGAAYFFTDVSCGNGRIDPGEQCDDGNYVDGDGCDSNCTSTGCGNGVVTAGEQCDDGNLVNADGCSAQCQREGICGNGVREFFETCDDGNLVNGDGCDSNCTLTRCGNGIATAGEQCDDGATNGSDLCCSVNCRVVDTDGDGLCDRDDVCPTVPDPGQANSDGDVFGDACDLCPADADNDSDSDGFCLGAAFRAPAIGGDDPCSRLDSAGAWLKPQAVFTLLDSPGSEKMRLKGSFTIVHAVPRLDPLQYGIRIRVVDNAGKVIVDERVARGSVASAGDLSGWKVSGNPPIKWMYVDKNEPPLHSGIRTIVVKDRSRFEPGLLTFLLKAKGGTYDLAPGQDQEPLTVTVELNDTALPPGRTPGRDQCGEARFKSPPDVPSCRFQNVSLLCK